MKLTDWISRADALLCELDELPDELAAKEIAELKKLAKFLPWDPDLAPEIDMRLAELDNATVEKAVDSTPSSWGPAVPPPAEAREAIAAGWEAVVPSLTEESPSGISAEKKFDAFISIARVLYRHVPEYGPNRAYRAAIMEDIIADVHKIVYAAMRAAERKY